MGVGSLSGKKMVEQPTKILVGIPVGLESWIQLGTARWLSQAVKKNIDWYGWPSRAAEEGRNALVDLFLKNPRFTHLFFLDSDVVPPDDAIEKLLALDCDIAGGLCPVWYHGGRWWNVCKYDRQNKYYIMIPHNKELIEPFEVDAMGGTTLLIKRKVLETLEWPWFRTNYYRSGYVLSEDIYFTQKAKQAKFTIKIDPTVRCRHTNRVWLDEVFNAV